MDSKVSYTRPAVSVKDAGVMRSGKNLLCGINASVGWNESVLIVGSSGSGKTTLLKLILGLLENNDEWQFAGRVNVSTGSVGWVSQNPTNDLINNWVDEEASRTDLEKFSAAHLSGKRTFEISHGEKVLVSLAKAFSRSLVLLDEPGICLDSDNRRKLIQVIRDSGSAVIIVDHHPEFMEIANRVFMMDKGYLKEISKEQAKVFLSYIPELKTYAPQRTDFSSDKGLLRIVSSDMDVSIAAGSVVGISGENGSGKTTLLNLIAGISTRTGFACYWNDRHLKGIRQRKGLMGIVPQEPDRYFFEKSLPRHMAFMDISAEHAGLGIDGPAAGISVADLSSGQKQRLALAGASKARITLMDEPTYGLDRYNKEWLINIILSKKKNSDIVIIASHDHGLLDAVCTQTISL
ncbi:ATP-binding cassette domain-containing protein [Elusimicrobiota bacterium]